MYRWTGEYVKSGRETHLINLTVGSIADDLDELEDTSRILKARKTKLVRYNNASIE